MVMRILNLCQEIIMNIMQSTLLEYVSLHQPTIRCKKNNY